MLLNNYSKMLLKEEEFNSENLTKFLSAVSALRERVDHVPFGWSTDEFSVIKEALEEIKGIFVEMKPDLEKIINPKGEYSGHKHTLLRLEEAVNQVWSEKGMLERRVAGKFKQKLRGNFIGNFQVRDLSDLFGSDGSYARFDIHGFNVMGHFVFGEEGDTGMMSTEFIRQMQQHSKVLFLGSPLFWSLSRALVLGEKNTYLSHWERVPLVPNYFHDMMNAVSETGLGEPIFPEVLKELTDEIGGRVAISDTNELTFREEGGGNYPLSQTATGISNLGMLGLLIEKNLLDESTFLFIDEPEAHLHPAWQVAMAKTLFALSERGINVVLATHSAEILKWLEVKVKESPEAKEKIALNHFKNGTVEGNGKGFTERLEAIQEDLADPFYRLLYRGLS